MYYTTEMIGCKEIIQKPAVSIRRKTGLANASSLMLKQQNQADAWKRRMIPKQTACLLRCRWMKYEKKGEWFYQKPKKYFIIALREISWENERSCWRKHARRTGRELEEDCTTQRSSRQRISMYLLPFSPWACLAVEHAYLHKRLFTKLFIKISARTRNERQKKLLNFEIIHWKRLESGKLKWLYVMFCYFLRHHTVL